MAKKVDDLTAIQIKRLMEPGLHAVGTVPGLRLNVSETGARSWILRTMVGSKRKDIGLGCSQQICNMSTNINFRSLMST
jgi:hypothetical protein